MGCARLTDDWGGDDRAAGRLHAWKHPGSKMTKMTTKVGRNAVNKIVSWAVLCGWELWDAGNHSASKEIFLVYAAR